MDSSIILIPIIIISVILTLKILKSPEFRQTTAETKKAFIRLYIGGFAGAVLLVSIFWLYLIAVGRTPDKLNPYVEIMPYFASFYMALIGFWAGSIADLPMKRNQKK